MTVSLVVPSLLRKPPIKGWGGGSCKVPSKRSAGSVEGPILHMIISSQINSCLNRNKIKHRCSYVFRDRAKKIVLSVVCRSHAHSSIVVTQESAVFEESNLCVGWFKK